MKFFTERKRHSELSGYVITSLLNSKVIDLIKSWPALSDSSDKKDGNDHCRVIGQTLELLT